MMIDKETYMTSEGFYKATVEDLKRLKMNTKTLKVIRTLKQH